MNVFLRLVAVIRIGWPLPDFVNAKALALWIANLSEPAAELIAGLVADLRAKHAAGEPIELPDGTLLAVGALASEETCCLLCAAMDRHGEQAEAELTRTGIVGAPMVEVEARINWQGLGKKLMPWLQKLLPLLLPLVLEPTPAPKEV